jgi:hypothetical protein
MTTQPPELIGYAAIGRLAGVTRQRARELAQRPGFPDPAVRSDHTGPLFDQAAVERWLAAWDRQTGRPRKAV